MKRSIFVLIISLLAQCIYALETLSKVTKKVYFDIEIDGSVAGRVTFGLFGQDAPKTAKNFEKLCEGSHGRGNQGKQLWYKNSVFHRIIPNFMAQGGDIISGDGRGGESIYGKNFSDENFVLKHEKPYLLSTANNGPNTNNSQFFIALRPVPWLDGKHTVFGEVIDGFDVVKQIENVGSGTGQPTKQVVILDSGVLK